MRETVQGKLSEKRNQQENKPRLRGVVILIISVPVLSFDAKMMICFLCEDAVSNCVFFVHPSTKCRDFAQTSLSFMPAPKNT